MRWNTFIILTTFITSVSSYILFAFMSKSTRIQFLGGWNCGDGTPEQYLLADNNWTAKTYRPFTPLDCSFKQNLIS